MSHHLGVNDLQNIAGGASISSGLITWFGENASAVGALMTVLTFIAFVTFSFLNYLINRRNVIHRETIKRDVIDTLIDKAEKTEKEIIRRLAHK